MRDDVRDELLLGSRGKRTLRNYATTQLRNDHPTQPSFSAIAARPECQRFPDAPEIRTADTAHERLPC